MKINNEELKEIIEYGFEYLKPYSIVLLENSIVIKDRICMDSIVDLKGKKIDIHISYLIQYNKPFLSIYNIEGNVYYNKFKVPYMNILKGINRCSLIEIKNKEIVLKYNLPIDTIKITDELEIKILNRKN